MPKEVTRVVNPVEEGKPVKQPRHFVLKKFEEHMSAQGLAFVAVADVKKTTPAVAPYVKALDYIVLRGEEKLLVTIRPNLQLSHLTAVRELKKLFGDGYQPVRIWPAGEEWTWKEHSIGTN